MWPALPNWIRPLGGKATAKDDPPLGGDARRGRGIDEPLKQELRCLPLGPGRDALRIENRQPGAALYLCRHHRYPAWLSQHGFGPMECPQCDEVTKANLLADGTNPCSCVAERTLPVAAAQGTP